MQTRSSGLRGQTFLSLTSTASGFRKATQSTLCLSLFDEKECPDGKKLASGGTD